MEWLGVIVIAAIIFCVPLLVVRYAGVRRDRGCLRKIDQRVKNELLSRESYGVIGADVMAMVKGHILRSHAVLLFGWEILIIVVSVLGGGEILVAAVVFPVIPISIGLAVSLHGLSDEASLIKVRAFVFRKSSYEVSVSYYDMQRLEYRVFTQGTVFGGIDDTVRAGEYVNLIVRRKERGYRVVRILRF